MKNFYLEGKVNKENYSQSSLEKELSDSQGSNNNKSSCKQREDQE
jgi:hypothetical protein